MNMMVDKKPDEKLTQKHIYEIGIIDEKAKKLVLLTLLMWEPALQKRIIAS